MNGICLSPAAGTYASYYPADKVAGEIAACLTAWLVCWVDPSKLGRVFINTGFQFPNHDIQALGISFISETRLEYGLNYLEIAPDLVIEIKSTKESLISLQASIEKMLELGTRIGMVINPEEQTVTLYRPNDDITLLTNTDIIEIPDLLPGWKLPISSIWVPEPIQNRCNPSLKIGVE
jgi:Uma2 family endonuclease